MNADSFESWLFVFLIRGGAIAAAWLLAGIWLRNVSASRVSAWWRGGFVALLVAAIVPPDTALVRIPSLRSVPAPVPAPVMQDISEAAESTDHLASKPVNLVVTSSPRIPAIRWWTWLWFAGVVVLFGRLLSSRVRVNATIHSGEPVTDPKILAMIEEECGPLGLGRPVALKARKDITTPFATGLFRLTIVLPESSMACLNDLRLMIRHELSHFARFDLAWQWLAEMVVILHWINPFAWFLKRRLRLDHESAADDMVLSRGTDEVRYAAILFEAVRKKCRMTHEALVVPMARPSTLRRRVGLLLDDTRDRRIAGPGARLVAVAIACIAAVAIGFTSVRAEAEKKTNQTWSRRFHDTLSLEKSFADRFKGSKSEALTAFCKELEARGIPLDDSMKFELSPDKTTLIVDFEEADRGAIEGKMLQLMNRAGWWRDDESVRQQTVEKVLSPLREKVEQAAREMAEIRTAKNLVDSDSENSMATISSAADSNVVKLETQLQKSSLRVLDLEERFQRLTKLQAEEIVTALRTAKVEDRTMEKMQDALQDAVAEGAKLAASGIGEKHPRRLAIRNQIEYLLKTMADAGASLKQNQAALLEVERRTLEKTRTEFEEAQKKQIQDKAEILKYLKVKEEYLKNKRGYETVKMKYEIEELERGDRQGVR
jgi:beta-lactamase regulating signal transducer with metallopeptidase domain